MIEDFYDPDLSHNAEPTPHQFQIRLIFGDWGNSNLCSVFCRYGVSLVCVAEV